MDTRLKLTPVVAIVGRPNTGKSTMFNRLLERRKAITSGKEGTTRDLNYGSFEWRGVTVTTIDTAGLDLTSDRATEEALKRQAESAMAKADIILMLTDATAGIMPQDRALSKHLLQSKKPILLVTNKADSPNSRRRAESPDWMRLGLGKPLPCSAINGSGVGDMLDVLIEKIRERKLDSVPIPEPDLKMVLIGKPNVGKSSLLNALAGEERVIVSEIAHTTKEPQDTMIAFDDPESGERKNVRIFDTVGIRKQAKVEPGIEHTGVGMSFNEMRQADVALLMVDAAEGISAQEKRLTGLIEDSRVGIVVVANKWDIAEEKRIGDAEEFRQHLAVSMPFCAWSPLLFVSAKTGRGVNKVIPMALKVLEQRRRVIGQPDLDAFFERMQRIHHTAFKKGMARPKVYGLKQTGTEPPEITMTVKKKETIHPNYIRFVENRIRDEYGFEGTPIRLAVREIKR
ncbi:ribosome biogenesis GTPase Der [Candidatus Uhrbacteria bacterium]|nr:ribosome biogenesis GTPase Der [Candidatus Uhrbacteria bacterium]